MSLEPKLDYTRKLAFTLCSCGQCFIYINVVAMILMGMRLVGIIEAIKGDDGTTPGLSSYFDEWNIDLNETLPGYAQKVLEAEMNVLTARGNRFYQLHTSTPTNLDNTIFLAESLLYIL